MSDGGDRPLAAEDFDCDYLIVGSGFGGSVAALRLAEKGYRVVVLEAGRRWKTGEFPKTNWNLAKFLWWPALGWYGIQRITLLRNVLVLSGAGVGGGSLVYANTLLEPSDAFFGDSRWAGLADWRRELAPHYATARQMLGAAPARFLGPGDRVLREVAAELGRGDTFHQPEVAVYFGSPNVEAPDPYFGGLGPPRVGCTHCGGCMVGCNVGAKNTLDKNYLHLAEQRGARIEPLTTVDGVRPVPGGYVVEARRTGSVFARRGRRAFRARRVVFAAGVLGTVPLLLRCRERGLLPKLSPRLGEYVRTNSEAIVGAMSRRADVDNSRGIAITSGFYPEPGTHVQIVRYGAGQDAMGRLSALMVDGGGGRLRRLVRFLTALALHPIDFLRTQYPFGWAKRTVILLVMQAVDNHLTVRLRRRGLWPFAKVLDSTSGGGEPPPSYIPVANLVARKVAEKTDGVALGAINEALFDAPTTAHILGGCCMGESADTGVIDRNHEVFGYPGLYVCDGSAISANLGVNPSLTITALTELAMSKIATASRPVAAQLRPGEGDLPPCGAAAPPDGA